MHVCRGNQSSMWLGEGDYQPIDEAAKYADIDRLALSPQCGFASIALGGGRLSADEQFAKLRLVAHTARTAWGQAA